VSEVAVAVRAGPDAEKQLVAYLTASGDARPTVPELRSFLSERFPDYMVPSGYVWLAELPRNLSGKVDRGALPAPGTERPDLGHDAAPAESPLEEALAAIWAGVLGLDEVGVRDNFLALGGNSLAAARVGVRVREQFGVEMDLRLLFADLTIAGQARAVLRAQVDQTDGATLARLLGKAGVGPPGGPGSEMD
jgi:acyl carrier protein